MLSRFAPNDILLEEFKLYPLTMCRFIKGAQKCTKLFLTVTKCENRGQMPFMISIYLLPD